MKNIRKWFLHYFDWNNDGKTNWWEYLIPIGIILLIEIIAEIIAQWIVY
jgi:hypothetical protein